MRKDFRLVMILLKNAGKKLIRIDIKGSIECLRVIKIILKHHLLRTLLIIMKFATGED